VRLLGSKYIQYDYLLTSWSRVLLEKLTGFHLVKFLYFMEPESSLPYSQVLAPRLSGWIFCNKICFCDESLAPRPTSRMEDHPLSAIHNCLFNIFAASLHIGGRSSIRNLRMCHAVVTGTYLKQTIWLLHGTYTTLILQGFCHLEPYTLMIY